MNPRQAPYICKTLSDGPGKPPGKTAFQVPVALPYMVDPDIALERQVMGFTDTRDDVAGHAAEFKRDLPGCVSDTTGQHILARPPVQEGIASILCLMDKQESGPVRRKPPGRRRFRSDLSASPHRRLYPDQAFHPRERSQFVSEPSCTPKNRPRRSIRPVCSRGRLPCLPLISHP